MLSSLFSFRQSARALLICWSIMTVSATPAEDPDLPAVRQNNPLQGLVIDRTLTPPGRNFYKQFARIWWELNHSINGNLVIAENPDALRGSRIMISMNRKMLYITVLSPARSEIEKKAMNAVNTVEKRARYLLNNSSAQHSEDLAEDEF